jgi:glycosyltransferase involved in cell wall biosynthesis
LPRKDLRSFPDRILKWRETRLSRKAAMVVIQDPSRARVLIEDNAVDARRVVYAPNAPSGRARRAPTKWWHERLDLPDDRLVLLHAGGIGSWTGIRDLVEAAADLPDPWVLVVHSHGRPSDRARLQELRSARSGGKVFFSDGAVRRQDYRSLVDGADAGLAFYIPEPGRSTMTNIKTLGLSSGKVAYYLWCGLPVIVNSSTSLGDLVERERIGVQIDSALDLGQAVRIVAADNEQLSSQAVGYFNARLDFTASARRICDVVDQLTSGAASRTLLPQRER